MFCDFDRWCCYRFLPAFHTLLSYFCASHFLFLSSLLLFHSVREWAAEHAAERTRERSWSAGVYCANGLRGMKATEREREGEAKHRCTSVTRIHFINYLPHSLTLSSSLSISGLMQSSLCHLTKRSSQLDHSLSLSLSLCARMRTFNCYSLTFPVLWKSFN